MVNGHGARLNPRAVVRPSGGSAGALPACSRSGQECAGCAETAGKSDAPRSMRPQVHGEHAAVPARRMPPFLWWRPGSNPGCIGQGQFECARVGQGLPVSGCPAENQRSNPGEPACPAIADASPARPNPCKGAQQPRMRGLPSDRSSTTRMRCKTDPTAQSSG